MAIAFSGRLLRDARARVGFSQQALADAVAQLMERAVRAEEIRRWEMGRYAPNGVALLSLAACLEIRAEELVAEVDLADDEAPGGDGAPHAPSARHSFDSRRALTAGTLPATSDRFSPQTRHVRFVDEVLRLLDGIRDDPRWLPLVRLWRSDPAFDRWFWEEVAPLIRAGTMAVLGRLYKAAMEDGKNALKAAELYLKFSGHFDAPDRPESRASFFELLDRKEQEAMEGEQGRPRLDGRALEDKRTVGDLTTRRTFLPR